MTRINVIPVEELSDQHLFAEVRELKRIPNVVKQGKYSLNDCPDKYTMGTGHVKFFYNKLLFLHNRSRLLYSECLNRGFVVTDYSSCFVDLPNELYNDWQPSEQDIRISRTRIAEKIYQKDIVQQKGFYRWTK